MPSLRQIPNQKPALDLIFFSTDMIELFFDCNVTGVDNLKREARNLRQQTMLCFAL